MNKAPANRELTGTERHLAEWMLQHGRPEARQFLSQLQLAQVTPWQCGCGCASVQFAIQGQPTPSGGIQPIADFDFGSGDYWGGIFIYAQNDVLAGIEVYLFGSGVPTLLPTSKELRPLLDEPASLLPPSISPT